MSNCEIPHDREFLHEAASRGSGWMEQSIHRPGEHLARKANANRAANTCSYESFSFDHYAVAWIEREF
jgi:hypothetical protein